MRPPYGIDLPPPPDPDDDDEEGPRPPEPRRPWGPTVWGR
jgi:hypothetical protein